MDLYIGEGLVVEEILKVMEGPNIRAEYRTAHHVEFAYTTKTDAIPNMLQMLISRFHPTRQNGPERPDLA